MAEPTQADLDNRSNQLNPNNDEYWNSRGQGDNGANDVEYEWMPDNPD